MKQNQKHLLNKPVCSHFFILSPKKKLQEKANELYPGLFRPIIVRNSRYNQHLTKAAVIIEVGATGNTLEQCLVSMKYLAKVISEVMK